MRLSVRHRTVYAFDAPMRWIVQSHRLTPSACASQRTLAWTVAADGGEIGAAFVDGAGDAVSTLTIVGPVERVEVLVEGEVETADTSGILRDHREIISPRAYLVATAATHPNRALAELADAAVKGASDADELARAHRLAAAVADAIAYAPGRPPTPTPPAARGARAGQGRLPGPRPRADRARASLRPARPLRLRLPLRRRGGRRRRGEPRLGRDLVSRLGWIGFDAANRCCPGRALHPPRPRGRDAREAAPIRGVSRGGGTEVLDVDVSVAQAPARSQSQTQQ